jgi:hypothetical protein
MEEIRAEDGEMHMAFANLFAVFIGNIKRESARSALLVGQTNKRLTCCSALANAHGDGSWGPGKVDALLALDNDICLLRNTLATTKGAASK